MTLSKGGSRLQFAAAADLADPLGPNGPPQNAAYYIDGAGKWGIEWTNYDPAYYTQVSADAGTSVWRTLGPGSTYILIGPTPIDTDYYVRHQQGGYFSDWVAPAV